MFERLPTFLVLQDTLKTTYRKFYIKACQVLQDLSRGTHDLFTSHRQVIVEQNRDSMTPALQVTESYLSP